MRRAQRLDYFTTARELYESGQSMREIAKQLQLGRKTVRRFVRFVVADEFPELGTRRRMYSKLDPFVPYLDQKLVAAQGNGMES